MLFNNVGSSTVYDLKNQRIKSLSFLPKVTVKKSMSIHKTLKEGKSSDFDSALIHWFKLRRNEGVRISGEMVMAQAKIFHKELNLQHECDYSQEWLQKFQQDMIWTLARAWKRVTPSTLKNGWHKLLPALKFEDSSDVNAESMFTGFEVSENQKIISELMEYASGMSHPVILELAKILGEENLLDWMEVDTDAVDTIANQMMDEEIVQMVQQGKNKDNEEASDGDEDDDEYVTEKISIDKCIQLVTNLIEGLEQRRFISEQAIMSLYMIREKLIKEKTKYMRQAQLEDWLKVDKRNVEQHSTVRSPVASTSSTPDIPTAETADVT
uniref:HTH CENPB-type domain-containing protein n=1 Tax=Chrysemys picta bellii TaxID=8478 RepID=A0A8C3F5U8_CHRPI